MTLESFGAFESGEMSESAFEALREKMKAAAAQIKAIKKEEGKHKKKEDELQKILLKFVRNSHKSGLVLLISRALEQNIPANFILAIVLLGNEEIQKDLGTFLLLPDSVPQESSAEAQAQDNALIFFNSHSDQAMPLRVKIELDNWIKAILVQAEERPQKLINTAYLIKMIEEEHESEFGETKYREEKSIKVVLIDLFAFVLADYLASKEINEEDSKLKDFAQFILTGILKKTEENLSNRKHLQGDVSDPI